VPALLMARHHPSGGQSRSRDPRCRARGRMPSRRRWRYMTARARRPTLPTARPPRYPAAGQDRPVASGACSARAARSGK
jgi:hypothetical protein